MESLQCRVASGKLVQSKAETYTAEQTWSDLRHWFARFKRRGKVVSRCLGDLIHAIAIYFHRVNLRYEVTEKGQGNFGLK